MIAPRAGELAERAVALRALVEALAKRIREIRAQQGLPAPARIEVARGS